MTTIFLSVLGPGLALHGPQGRLCMFSDCIRSNLSKPALVFNRVHGKGGNWNETRSGSSVPFI
jgi:hypothetical protein